jgi:hypothetical protein
MNCENCEIDHDGSYASGRFCTAKCARSFSSKVKREEINQKVSATLKGRQSPLKGKPSNRKLTETQYQKFLEGIRRYNNTRVRIPEAQKRAANVANVMAYRARMYAATPDDVDRNLIKTIYENCPAGYHVDHIHSLSTGGAHHQDNLQYLPASENCRKCADRDYDHSLAIDWRTIIPGYPNGKGTHC